MTHIPESKCFSKALSNHAKNATSFGGLTQNKALKDLRLTGIFIFFMIKFATVSFSQSVCAGISYGACVKDFQTYQCIDGNFTASSLYFSQLLPPAQALTTPQYLVIKGKISFSEDYTFASGSEIVFLDNNSGFKVLALTGLTLNQTHLHGCTRVFGQVWKSWAMPRLLPKNVLLKMQRLLSY